MENQEEVTQIKQEDAIAIHEASERAEYDIQISTAKKYPRSLTTVSDNAVAIATMNMETAKSCGYSLPRAGKIISGPSVHLARILASEYGNLRVEAKVINITHNQIVSQAVCFDLEKNYAVKVEVRKRITNKHYERFSEDMIVVTGNAANAIAYRNAVYNVIPKSVIDNVYSATRQLITGDLSDENKLIKKRIGLLTGFKDNYGISEEEILKLLGLNTVNQIKQNEIITLIGLAQAILDGDTTVEETFGRTEGEAITKRGDPIKLSKDKDLANKLAEKVKKNRIRADDVQLENKVYPVVEEEATKEVPEDKPETPKITLPENIDIKTYNYSETELSFLGTGKEIYEILVAKGIDPDKFEGKNTNKKLRNLILQKQAETIEQKVNKNNDNIEEAEEVETPSEPELLEVKTNKLGIKVFDLPEAGKRDFQTEMYPMFNEFQKKGLTPEIVNEKIKKLELKEKYNDIEDLLRNGTVNEINLVINTE